MKKHLMINEGEEHLCGTPFACSDEAMKTCKKDMEYETIVCKELK